MALWVVMLVALLASLLILNDNGVDGARSLSMEEDLELERQLKHLNKPAVKSIKTKYGDIYDCVDFYKQPAFDNPLLKNHKPEMSSSIPRETLKEGSSSGVEHVNLKLEGGGCPSGTVPIRRTTKEDLIRWNSSSNSSGNIHQFLYEGPGTHFAGFQVKDENLKYHGALAHITIYNPSVSANQYSGAMVWVQGGQNHVQAGWHVNPKLYGDHKSHLFGHWTSDGSQNTGCFNAICKGFVQVSKDEPLGLALDKTSTLGGQRYSLPTFIFQNKNSGNWWLALGDDIVDIGYWPKELFKSITEFAPMVGWRGEVYAPHGEQSPQMGTGKFPSETEPKAYNTVAYFRAAKVYNEAYIGADPHSLEVVTDAPWCYSATYDYYNDDRWRTTLYFGGPGGNCEG